MTNWFINLFLILFYYEQEQEFTHKIGQQRAKWMNWLDEVEPLDE